MLKLRRPTLGDKEAILDMMVEFEQLQTAHDGGFWGKTDCDCFDYDQFGYSIRPSARGKGYAKEQLRLGLLEAKAKNIKKVLITCHNDNAASRAVILANGGVLEDIRNQIERYWIDLEGKDDLEHTETRRVEE
ncbi:GNAT family N-acetyltransferase [Streptococcus mutans]|uniref:GNAT family N-acetyltransferase n=1 Tax=Streptococcus mutans TaxID=1309 RepID=UPI003724566E